MTFIKSKQKNQSFTQSRSLIAKQAMEIVQIIGSEDPFEKFEIACYLYDNLINKESYQLVINCFEDEVDRDNLIHRLGINKKAKVLTASSTNQLESGNGLASSRSHSNGGKIKVQQQNKFQSNEDGSMHLP